jgi:hypothetical protein
MIIKHLDFALDKDSACIGSIFEKEIYQGLFKPKKKMFYFEFQDKLQSGREIGDDYDKIKKIWEELIEAINGAKIQLN